VCRLHSPTLDWQYATHGLLLKISLKFFAVSRKLAEFWIYIEVRLSQISGEFLLSRNYFWTTATDCALAVSAVRPRRVFCRDARACDAGRGVCGIVYSLDPVISKWLDATVVLSMLLLLMNDNDARFDDISSYPRHLLHSEMRSASTTLVLLLLFVLLHTQSLR